MDIRRILVATDLSHSSLTLLLHAGALARRLDVPVELLHVEAIHGLQLPLTGRSARIRQELAARRPAELEAARASLERGGVTAGATIMVGEPAAVILSAVRERDLLVVGRRGLRVEYGQDSGPTALRVLTRAAVPVLVVPGLCPEQDLPGEEPGLSHLVSITRGSALCGAARRATSALAGRLGARVADVHLALDHGGDERRETRHLAWPRCHRMPLPRAGLLAMPSRTADDPPRRLGESAAAVLRRARVPTLLLPPAYLERWDNRPGGVDLAA